MTSRRYAWLVVGLLWVVACLNYLDRQVIFSVFPLIRAEMRLDDFQLGLLSTVFLWVYGFASPFGGYLADRVGRKKVLLLSLAIWTTVTLLTGYVRDFQQLLIARALMGLSEACYLPAALALIAELHDKGRLSMATGFRRLAFHFGRAQNGQPRGSTRGLRRMRPRSCQIPNVGQPHRRSVPPAMEASSRPPAQP
jgi:MFS family permease